MPFRPVCCCPFHSKWGFGDPKASSVDLKNATSCHLAYCKINEDKKHSDRKRKICVACAGKIDVEEASGKRQKVEVSSTFTLFGLFTCSLGTVCNFHFLSIRLKRYSIFS